MATTPFSDIKDPILQITIKLDGSIMSDRYGVTSIQVQHAINTISTAQLSFSGSIDVNTGDISITDSDDFNPGKKVEILAGYGEGDVKNIFKGIIVTHTLKLGPGTNFTLCIKCKHEAAAMNFAEKEQFFVQLSDRDIIKNITDGYGIACDTRQGIISNENLFQKNCTDWDFILSRCNHNGYVVTMDGDSGLLIDAPKLSDRAVLTIENGDSIIAFEAGLHAANQPVSVTASAWDDDTKTLVSVTAAELSMNEQGHIKATNLAAQMPGGVIKLLSPSPMTKESLQKWADSVLLRKRLSATRGNVSFIGNAGIKTGNIIELKGVGKKFNGKAFVSAVTHTIVAGEWTTAAVFGLDDIAVSTYPVYQTATAAIQGLQLATVIKIEQDPENRYRIQVAIPSASGAVNNAWAVMAHFNASNNSGAFFIPEIGDDVVLGYLGNDAGNPVILGSVYNRHHAAPYAAADVNNTRALVTRNQMKIEFNEEKKNISISTPAGNTILLSEDGKLVEFKDQNGNSITLSNDGIILNSVKDLKITASGAIDIIANTDLKIKGVNVIAEAAVAFAGKGNATAELSASGQTTVKGGMVMIN